MSEELDAKKAEIEETFAELQTRANMASLQETLSSTAAEIAELPAKIQGIRDRGYAFAGYLEGKAETLAKQWDEIDHNAKITMRNTTADLKKEVEEIESEVERMRSAGDAIANKVVEDLEPALVALDTKISSAEETVSATFGGVPGNVRQTWSQLETIEGYLDLAVEASFDLVAGESVFMAVKAEWEKTGKDKNDPDGVFYITDQRIVMEQKEKVGKNMLGMGGKMQQEILWEAPINTVAEVAHEKKGLMGGIDLIHINFGSGGPFGDTTIEVKGGIQAKWFAGQLKRAATGGLEKERGMIPDQELVEAIADAPEICGVCGATLDQPVSAGMTQIQCAYCGAITRLSV